MHKVLLQAFHNETKAIAGQEICLMDKVDENKSSIIDQIAEASSVAADVVENHIYFELYTVFNLEPAIAEMKNGYLGSFYRDSEKAACEKLDVVSISDIDFQVHDDSVHEHIQLANELTEEEEAMTAIALLKSHGMDEYANKLENLISHSLAHVTAQEAIN